ncbi:hypothetical protein TTHERM_00324450 (macronuclear) [Tetrahymena thermophila SB210]|uniref:AMP-binding enzyme family protein n=1 Tax=Tetrahymena thermophila (strain SB210) TaxID=312017 RepID=Q237F4_TETTS|nr:hypothetical protein TTHERM_00324450 [Tetrahymena thermophila SB210]EAR92787.2 hypothetical protein TTHERM_00324450 [Tetrahymena thermophila SB210]|eukprot:XP_001013032.2 hypothetical protein TTHERM_00324450 [Tetrahymena thermophila SB210]
MLIYSSYLFYLYFNNQINPNYSSQSFISEEIISIDLQNDLFGFKYEYGVNLNLDDLQEQQNKTYLVYVPFFYYQNGSDYQMIPLNYTKCSNTKLQGFNCLDFSNLKNYSLTLSTQDNISSNIYVFVYQCQDTDMFKEFIPDNCANQTEINSTINNPYADFRLKFLTSQYNTTSQAIQTNYRNSYVYMQGDQFQLYTFKTQKQITQLKQGAIIQSESTFSSPISYDIQNFSYSRESMIQTFGQTSYLQITIEMDEIVQNMFLGTYQNILKENKILDKKDDDYFKNQMKFDKNRIEEREEDMKVDSVQEIIVPSFDTKLIKSICSSQNQSPKNQIQPSIMNSPTCQNNRFTSFELAAQKLCFKVSDYQQSQGLGQNDKRAIDDYINQSLDILQLYRDITLLKKAALILLSKDQLAILQLVGLSSDFQKEPEKMSFFEEQYSILSDSSLQEKYINSFFKRIQDSQEISETDLRILDSLQ